MNQKTNFLCLKLGEKEGAFDELHKRYTTLLKRQKELEKENERLKDENKRLRWDLDKTRKDLSYFANLKIESIGGVFNE